jgi:hypothetical protein
LEPLPKIWNSHWPLGHLGVDTFVVDAGHQTKIEMLLDHLAGDVADILVTDAGIVGALRRRIAG